jgi:hypothetical protein
MRGALFVDVTVHGVTLFEGCPGLTDALGSAGVLQCLLLETSTGAAKALQE